MAAAHRARVCSHVAEVCQRPQAQHFPSSPPAELLLFWKGSATRMTSALAAAADRPPHPRASEALSLSKDAISARSHEHIHAGDMLVLRTNSKQSLSHQLERLYRPKQLEYVEK